MRKLVILVSVIFLASCAQKPITPGTAMKSYLEKNEEVLKWEIQDQQKTGDMTFYRLIFKSQKWRDIDWIHELTIIVPDKIEYKDALLFITGGSVKNGKPNTHEFTEELITAMKEISETNHTLVAILWQVPNQPLYNDLTEDALISYTLHNYLNDHDFTWPLLFPMTKSAVKAMDVVQEFSKKNIKTEIDQFVISGASKRGWTTWLTGANDKRVKAICPMVIDVLNMPVNVDYQKVVWGDYSIEIEDYVNLGIAQQMSTPGGNDLVEMVDPYSYRKNLTMPKMIFMGTNDPYWPVDAVKNYIDSIPGKNFICYTPNAGHDLAGGVKAFTTLSAFLGYTETDSDYPKIDYSVSETKDSVKVKVSSGTGFIDASLWISDSEDQDFRDEVWSDSVIVSANNKDVAVGISKPGSGFKAFYVDLKYKAPAGKDYTQSTRMYVVDKDKLLLK